MGASRSVGVMLASMDGNGLPLAWKCLMVSYDISMGSTIVLPALHSEGLGQEPWPCFEDFQFKISDFHYWFQTLTWKMNPPALT